MAKRKQSEYVKNSEIVAFRIRHSHLALALEHGIESGKPYQSKAEAVRILLEERLLQLFGMRVVDHSVSVKQQRILARYAQKTRQQLKHDQIEDRISQLRDEASNIELAKQVLNQMEAGEVTQVGLDVPESDEEMLLMGVNVKNKQVYDMLKGNDADAELLESAIEAPPEVIDNFFSLIKDFNVTDAYQLALDDYVKSLTGDNA